MRTGEPWPEPPVRFPPRRGQAESTRRRVSVSVHVHDHAIFGNTQFLRRIVDDSCIRLVRHVDVDVVDRPADLVEESLRRRHHHSRGELENLAAVHLHQPVGVLEGARTAAREPEVLAAAAVGAQLEAFEPALGDPLHHDRAGSVAEEDECRTVGPVENLREHVSADNERLLRETARDHCVGLREGVDEARAAGEEVVGGRLGSRQEVGEVTPWSGTSCPASPSRR